MATAKGLSKTLQPMFLTGGKGAERSRRQPRSHGQSRMPPGVVRRSGSASSDGNLPSSMTRSSAQRRRQSGRRQRGIQVGGLDAAAAVSPSPRLPVSPSPRLPVSPSLLLHCTIYYCKHQVTRTGLTVGLCLPRRAAAVDSQRRCIRYPEHTVTAKYPARSGSETWAFCTFWNFAATVSGRRVGAPAALKGYTGGSRVLRED